MLLSKRTRHVRYFISAVVIVLVVEVVLVAVVAVVIMPHLAEAAGKQRRPHALFVAIFSALF